MPLRLCWRWLFRDFVGMYGNGYRPLPWFLMSLCSCTYDAWCSKRGNYDDDLAVEREKIFNFLLDKQRSYLLSLCFQWRMEVLEHIPHLVRGGRHLKMLLWKGRRSKHLRQSHPLSFDSCSNGWQCHTEWLKINLPPRESKRIEIKIHDSFSLSKSISPKFLPPTTITSTSIPTPTIENDLISNPFKWNSLKMWFTEYDRRYKVGDLFARKECFIVAFAYFRSPFPASVPPLFYPPLQVCFFTIISSQL